MSVFEKARCSSLWIELPHALLSELAAAVSRISCYSHSRRAISRRALLAHRPPLPMSSIQLRGVELLVVQVCCVGRETRLPSGNVCDGTVGFACCGMMSGVLARAILPSCQFRCRFVCRKALQILRFLRIAHGSASSDKAGNTVLSGSCGTLQ